MKKSTKYILSLLTLTVVLTGCSQQSSINNAIDTQTPIGNLEDPGILGPKAQQVIIKYKEGGEAAVIEMAKSYNWNIKSTTDGILLPIILEPLSGLKPEDISSLEIESRGGQIDSTSQRFIRIFVSPEKLVNFSDLPNTKMAEMPATPLPLQ